MDRSVGMGGYMGIQNERHDGADTAQKIISRVEKTGAPMVIIVGRLMDQNGRVRNLRFATIGVQGRAGQGNNSKIQKGRSKI